MVSGAATTESNPYHIIITLLSQIRLISCFVTFAIRRPVWFPVKISAEKSASWDCIMSSSIVMSSRGLTTISFPFLHFLISHFLVSRSSFYKYPAGYVSGIAYSFVCGVLVSFLVMVSHFCAESLCLFSWSAFMHVPICAYSNPHQDPKMTPSSEGCTKFPYIIPFINCDQ